MAGRAGCLGCGRGAAWVIERRACGASARGSGGAWTTGGLGVTRVTSGTKNRSIPDHYAASIDSNDSRLRERYGNADHSRTR